MPVIIVEYEFINQFCQTKNNIQKLHFVSLQLGKIKTLIAVLGHENDVERYPAAWSCSIDEQLDLVVFNSFL